MRGGQGFGDYCTSICHGYSAKPHVVHISHNLSFFGFFTNINVGAFFNIWGFFFIEPWFLEFF